MAVADATTIFAPATAAGTAGVAVIRVSGPQTPSVVRKLIGKVLPPRHARLQNLKDPRDGSDIDRAITIWFPGPASFTGEDVLELQIHGSPALVQVLSDILVSLGLEPAQPGGFVRRAFENGKLDVIGVEALDAVLNASDPAGLKVAQGQFGQARQVLFQAWRQDLVRLQAACEALIDFPDDDLPQDLVAQNARRLARLTRQVAALNERSDKAQAIVSGFEILLVGPPNVGKSTLMNAIAGYERAIVTPVPGTTRDFVELEVRLGPFNVTFVDTAGLRSSHDEVEQMGIRRTRQRFETATLILNLHERGTRPMAIEAPCPVWTLQSKSHQPGRRSVAAGESGQAGLAALLQEVTTWLEKTYGSALTDMSFHGARQVFHVKQMARALRAAQHERLLPELQAESLRQAATALGHLSGQIHVEDVLDDLFKGFCIGK